MKIGQQVYGNEQQPPTEDNASAENSNSSEDEKVVDAEYEEVNDEKDKDSK